MITGLIRANVPTRIAFGCVTRMESQIILDQPGAELIAARGEFLARLPGLRGLVSGRSLYLSPREIAEAVACARFRVFHAGEGGCAME